ncbi:MAG: hypothetical protein WA943_02705 [Parvibaculum sp.]|jgi:hypothetical protein|uniref:hypothetical protein n=1 Tax=Parvibaculum sp. TaxID=2024848 RepID=UPI003C72D4CA
MKTSSRFVAPFVFAGAAAILAACAPTTTTHSTVTQTPGQTTVTADQPGADTTRPYSPGTTTTTTAPSTVTSTSVEKHY